MNSLFNMRWMNLHGESSALNNFSRTSMAEYLNNHKDAWRRVSTVPGRAWYWRSTIPGYAPTWIGWRETP